MKLIAVLFLCFLSSSADVLPVQNANCSDPQIFEAADLALKKYNKGKKDGNQFALHRITEASTTTSDDSGQQYFVTYETIESSCAVKDVTEWQDCQYRDAAEAETGVCKAHVYIKNLPEISSILSQHCNITPAEGPVISTQYVCLGCTHPISSNSEDLQPILRYAVQKFNDESDQPNLFKLGEVKKATRQVVAGWNYAFEYTIIETNCAKNETTDLNLHCGTAGITGICTADVFVSINGSIAAFRQNCRLSVDELVPPPVERCAGCPAHVDVNSKDLEVPLKHSINTFNSANNHTFLYKVESVQSATKQVVAGMKYVVHFTIGPTNCSKEDNDQLHDGCHFVEYVERKYCSSTVVVVAWLKKVDVEVNCVPYSPSVARYSIRGLSPFRSVGIMKREVGNHPGQGKGHGQENHPGQGKGHGHGKGKKHREECEHPGGKKPKHDKKKCREDGSHDSSEESHEHYTTKPVLPVASKIPHLPKPTSEPSVEKTGSTQNPGAADERPGVLATAQDPEEATTEAAVTTGDVAIIPIIPILPVAPENPGLFPNLPEDLLPDLPEPPAPMCPGAPWQPKPLLPPTPSAEPEGFDDDDLLPAATEEVTILSPEAAQPVSPGSSGGFADDDLLAAFS